MLSAVAQKVLGIPLYKYDIYVTVSGGIRVNDPGVDLAVVGAMYSSYKNKKLEKVSPVLIGEVSLLGVVKKVKYQERREKEVKNLGREMLKLENVAELKKLFN